MEEMSLRRDTEDDSSSSLDEEDGCSLKRRPEPVERGSEESDALERSDWLLVSLRPAPFPTDFLLGLVS